MFVLLEMIDVEPLDVRLFTKQDDAMAAFAACCLDGEVFPWSEEDLHGEMGGTLAIAGDDSYSVQLIEREEESIVVEGEPLKLLREGAEKSGEAEASASGPGWFWWPQTGSIVERGREE